MISFWRIFWLEIVGFVRSKALALLTLASLGWIVAMRLLVTGDGTAAGAREVFIRYALGGVFVLVVVTLAASGTGSLARERAARRLQLTCVRPVRMVVIVLAKNLALAACGAFVLLAASGLLVGLTGASARCYHVLKPILPSAREEAQAMYAAYLADPETPAAVKKAKKEVVLRLLENRAIDHYQTIGTNQTVSWTFPMLAAEETPGAVRVRLTNPFEMRQEVRGLFAYAGQTAAFTNLTQAILTVPFGTSAEASGAAKGELTFVNRGKSSLMLRPRRDLEVLVQADAFGWNVLRACLEMVAILTLVVAFCLFLSASLSHPVALFVAMAVLLLSEMSPSVADRYAEGLETNRLDRIGLFLTRRTAELTRPISSLNPMERLATDACLEWREVGRVLLTNAVLLPFLLAFLSAFVLPRKQDGL